MARYRRASRWEWRAAAGVAGIALCLLLTLPVDRAAARPDREAVERIELRVDYDDDRAAPRRHDRGTAVTALVVAAGVHLVGLGLWVTIRVARTRREDREGTVAPGRGLRG